MVFSQCQSSDRLGNFWRLLATNRSASAWSLLSIPMSWFLKQALTLACTRRRFAGLGFGGDDRAPGRLPLSCSIAQPRRMAAIRQQKIREQWMRSNVDIIERVDVVRELA